ncbi:MAG: Crp/Fnr family transcriptional regulator [Oscillospiraceae bacterium]|jgi:CRP-like cAMP-binding protein|nr:Crp/Fnr family transcriptional regulator [Oscillospiraceae bacterium]MDD3261860.1 Crp/Fnr family transcriptional regulator [Oscillospiraceae bacterium]
MLQLEKKDRFFTMLRRAPLFENIPEQEVSAAFQDNGCRCCSFTAGEKLPLWRCVGLVCSGELCAYQRTASGGEILMNDFQRNDVFGLAGTFLRREEPLSLMRAKRASIAMFLALPLLRELFTKDERIAENYIAYLSGRVAFLTQRLRVASGGTAQQRLVVWLLAQQVGEDGVLCLPCSLSSLSGLLGISRASLYRALDDLENADLLEQNGRRIRLLNREKMASFVGYIEEHDAPTGKSTS